MKENARQGFWNGALPPIGYRIVEAAEQRGHRVKKALEIDHIQAKTVRLIFRLAREGDGSSGADGRQVDHHAPQRRRHPHARRRPLGDRRRAQGAHPNDLHRPPPVQYQALEDA